ELDGDFDIVLFDGDNDSTNDNILRVLPYTDAAVIDGGDGLVSTTAAGDDVQVHSLGEVVTGGRIVILPGPNGILETEPAGDDNAGFIERLVEGFDGIRSTMITAGTDDILEFNVPSNNIAPGTVLISGGLNHRIDSLPAGDEYLRAIHTRMYATDPVNRDTDFDGISDGREVVLGTNPNRRDAGDVTDRDGDGLFDAEEEAGWIVTVVKPTGTETYRTYSDPDRADTDLDGLPDVYERAIGSDPTSRDTDGDGKRDGLEFDPDDVDNYYSEAALAEAESRCGSAPNCFYVNPNPMAGDRLRTNVNKWDTDGDALSDAHELDTDWIVQLVNVPAPVIVRSLAYRADSDNDGLNDYAEWLGADGIGPESPQDTADRTNPLSADTDSDSRSDQREVTQIVTDEGGRVAKTNPLLPDRLVVAEYIDAQILDDCDDGDGQNAGEWVWDFEFDVTGGLQDQSGATSNGNRYDVSDDNLPNSLPGFTSGSNRTNWTFAFVVPVGGSFNANGVANESDSGNDDEILTFSQSYTINATGTTSTVIASTLIQGSSPCQMNVYLTYSVE
ncbi:MAG: hypothetical protein AB7N71_08145, partial [Phycisphaerae bacterium]